MWDYGSCVQGLRAVHGGNIRLFKDTFITKIIACLRALMQSTNLCGTTKEVKWHLTSLGTTGSLPAKTIYSQCFFQWERRSHTFPSQTVYNLVYFIYMHFYIDMQYECM